MDKERLIGGVEMKCPYCGSTKGYYSLERLHHYLYFDFDGNPIGATEEYTDYNGKRKYCLDCERTLPSKMFKNIEGC